MHAAKGRGAVARELALRDSTARTPSNGSGSPLTARDPPRAPWNPRRPAHGDSLTWARPPRPERAPSGTETTPPRTDGAPLRTKAIPPQRSLPQPAEYRELFARGSIVPGGVRLAVEGGAAADVADPTKFKGDRRTLDPTSASFEGARTMFEGDRFSADAFLRYCVAFAQLAPRQTDAPLNRS